VIQILLSKRSSVRIVDLIFENGDNPNITCSFKKILCKLKEMNVSLIELFPPPLPLHYSEELGKLIQTFRK
jgi:hypothetical protein